jgi:hypothetical protein
MRLKSIIVFSFVAGCGSLSGLSGLLHGNSHSQQTTTSSTTTTESSHATVNGEPVAVNDEETPVRSHASRGHSGGGHSGGLKSYGATCQKNDECVSERGGCYKGYGGQVGYCTSGCDSDHDCPDFWECRRPAGLNTPSKICLQPKD